MRHLYFHLKNDITTPATETEERKRGNEEAGGKTGNAEADKWEKRLLKREEMEQTNEYRNCKQTRRAKK